MPKPTKETFNYGPRTRLILKDGNGSDVLNMELSITEALWEVTNYFFSHCSEGLNGSIYFEPVEETDA